MSETFAYLGHEAVETVVQDGLESLGWSRVADAAQASAVFTYYTHAGALEDAYFDTEGLVKRAGEGTLLVDLSPSTPSLARELSAVATVNDLRFVEAPIAVIDPSRADAFAADNMKCAIAADDEDALAEAEQIIGSFASTVERVGTCGQAQLAKAAHTAQTVAQVLGAVESAALYNVEGVAHGSGAPACSPIAAAMLEAIARDRFEGSYTVEMLMGDVVAAMTAADDASLILPQLEATMHLLEVLAVIGGADMAPAALSLLYRDEKASADNGLDWTRAEGLYDEGGHVCDHDHAHGRDDYGFDDADYDDNDPFGFAGGFGGYSAN